VGVIGLDFTREVFFFRVFLPARDQNYSLPILVLLGGWIGGEWAENGHENCPFDPVPFMRTILRLWEGIMLLVDQ
jgi:hypothetical protein